MSKTEEREKREEQEAVERYRKAEESASEIQKFGWTILWAVIFIFFIMLILNLGVH